MTDGGEVVGGEPYTLTLHVPAGFTTVRAVSEVAAELAPAADSIAALTLRPHQSGKVAWSVVFAPRGCDEPGGLARRRNTP